MRSVKSLLVAAAAAFVSTAAGAADMAIAPPPYVHPPVQEFGGWYLRGDIGFSNQKVDRLNNALDAGNFTSQQRLDFATAGIFGLGVGYKFNNWFRADLTGEYRGNSSFHGSDNITFDGGGGTTANGIDNYTATKSEWLALANAYIDLGTWWCITPFIGAGVGVANVRIANFTDNGFNNAGGTQNASAAFGSTVSKWNFAWAAHAGLAYQLTQNVTMELSYRYLDLGDGATGDLVTFTGVNAINNPMTFKHITSHDLRLGVRWACCDVPPPPAPPLIRKG